MAEFMVRNEHKAEQCQTLFDEWAEHSSSKAMTVKTWFCTCPNGEHAGVGHIEADSVDQILSGVGPVFRATSTVWGPGELIELP